MVYSRLETSMQLWLSVTNGVVLCGEPPTSSFKPCVAALLAHRAAFLSSSNRHQRQVTVKIALSAVPCAVRDQTTQFSSRHIRPPKMDSPVTS